MQLNAQSENQLRQDLQSTKNKTSQLQIRLRLLDAIYERNRNEWQKEVQILVSQRRAYVGSDNQAQISLLEAERARYQGDHQQLIEIFNQSIAPHNFSNPKAAWRKKILGCLLFPNDKKFHYKTLIAQANKGLKHREQTALYLQIAKNFSTLFQKDSAIWAGNIALQHAKRSDKKWVLIDAMQQQAEVYWQFNLFEQAVQRSINSLQLAEEAQLVHFKLSPLLLIASISIDVKNYNQAFTYLKLAQDLAKVNKDSRGQAYTNYLLGRYYLGINLPAKASTMAGLAYRFFLKMLATCVIRIERG